MIYENLSELDGKPVVDFVAGESIEPADYVYRLRLSWDDYDNGGSLGARVAKFAATDGSDLVEEIVIGVFDFEMGGSEAVVQALVDHREQLLSLRVLFFGDIMYEEQEISWISQSDLGPLLEAYPQLEDLTVRGDGGLRFSDFRHQNLRHLTIETGGLSPQPIADIVNAKLPSLESLEMWLGSPYYGFDSTTEEFAPLFSGEGFPKLIRLGLMNAMITDDLVQALSEAPLLDQIEHLDLSMGTLTDKGAEILSTHPRYANLKSLTVQHHFVEHPAYFGRLAEKGVDVHQAFAEDYFDDEPYCQVSE